MNELIFGISFIILIVIFVQKDKTIAYLSYNLNITIQSKTLVYILTFFFLLLIIAGVLLDNTKEKYSKISENYDSMRSPAEGKRPHRYFDINTYN